MQITKHFNAIKHTDYQGSEVINIKKEIFGEQLQKASKYTLFTIKI